MKHLFLLIAILYMISLICGLTSCVTSTTTTVAPDGTRTVTVTRGPDSETVSAVSSSVTSYAVARIVNPDK